MNYTQHCFYFLSTGYCPEMPTVLALMPNGETRTETVDCANKKKKNGSLKRQPIINEAYGGSKDTKSRIL